jgi:hypothetical protein
MNERIVPGPELIVDAAIVGAGPFMGVEGIREHA